MVSEPLPYVKIELFVTVANVYNLSSLVEKYSILYLARVPGTASCLGK